MKTFESDSLIEIIEFRFSKSVKFDGKSYANGIHFFRNVQEMLVITVGLENWCGSIMPACRLQSVEKADLLVDLAKGRGQVKVIIK